MTTGTRDLDRLYKLLPALYRVLEEYVPQPTGSGLPAPVRPPAPLQQLLRLVTEQADLLEWDIVRLWDDFFIETCEPWVVPYIGELVGNRLLHDVDRSGAPDLARERFPDLAGTDLRSGIAIRTRADVAKTIYYRRRKGTLPILEELARDVTGWAAHAVDMFETLEWTQYLNHLRPGSSECPDLRRVDAGDHIEGPFDFASHAVDVRPIAQDEGWYNIKNVAFFLWRLRAYPLFGVRARQSATVKRRFSFSVLGNPAPLFSPLQREGDEAGLATERHIPSPIRPAAFQEDLTAYRASGSTADHSTIYGAPQTYPGAAFAVYHDMTPALYRDATPVPPNAVRCHNLRPWPASSPSGLRAGEVWVDVHNGRILFGVGWPEKDDVVVSYHYGFPADLGGGPYERGKWLVDPRPLPPALPPVRYVVGPGHLPTIGDALDVWNPTRPPAVIEITDNASYPEEIAIELPEGGWLAIEAATGVRPHLRPTNGAIKVTTAATDSGATLTLSGLLIEGGVEISGDLARLRILHSTLVPGRSLHEDSGFATGTAASVVVNGTLKQDGVDVDINTQFRLETAFSIMGPLRVTDHGEGILLLDSIVDGVRTAAVNPRVAAIDTTETTPGMQHWAPPATIERCTILGNAFVRQLALASNSIFTEPVVVQQTQSGCVRFSYLAPDSHTPRRYRCQPDLEADLELERRRIRAATLPLAFDEKKERKLARTAVEAWLVPTFTSLRYGLPDYAQLRLGCPPQIRTGAEDGSEMGVFSHLKQPQRQTNLGIRLEEYLPLGLVPGAVFVT